MFSCLIIQYVTNLGSSPPPPPTCGHPSLPAWGMTPCSRLLPHVDTLLTNYGSDFPHQPVSPPMKMSSWPLSVSEGLPSSLCSSFDFPHGAISHLDTFLTPCFWNLMPGCLFPSHGCLIHPAWGLTSHARLSPAFCPPPLWIPSLPRWILNLLWASSTMTSSTRTEIFRNKRPQIGCLKYEETEIQELR